MNQKLKWLKRELSQLNLLANIEASSPDEQDAMLDLRDHQTFDVEWVRVDKGVKRHEAKQQLSEEDKNAIDELREMTFKKTYSVTGNGELASYASDDFDLIARALLVDYNDIWLNALWAQYQAGNFPHGALLNEA